MPLDYVKVRGSILNYIYVLPSHTSQIRVRKVGAYTFIRVGENNLTKYCQGNVYY